jgi:hypothetical protein
VKPRVVLGVVVALVLVAGVAVTIVLLSRGSDGVELPDEVDGLLARDAADAVPDDNERKDEILRDQREARERVAERYAEAYDGADADVRAYGDLTSDDATFYSVLAIELDAGPLLPDYLDDPETTGYAVPQVEVVHEDDADCVLRRNQPPIADSDSDSDSDSESDSGSESDSDSDGDGTAPDVVTCQRSSGSLTVRVTATSGPTVEDTVEFLDAVWSELS